MYTVLKFTSKNNSTFISDMIKLQFNSNEIDLLSMHGLKLEHIIFS
jgi:hypothetical protein